MRVGRGRFAQQAGHLGLQRQQAGVVGVGLGGAALQGGVLGLEGLSLLRRLPAPATVPMAADLYLRLTLAHGCIWPR